MSVSVLFFGATADAVGTKYLSVQAEEWRSVGCLLDQLVESYPPLHGSRLLISVNERYAGREAALKDGDEVAIFTPVSGG
jgi:MoaD family protein